jgi:hypothetical protein
VPPPCVPTYEYLQRTWREGKRVRTESRYIGPADAGGDRAPERGDGAESAAEPVNTTKAPRCVSAETVESAFAALGDPTLIKTSWHPAWGHDIERAGNRAKWCIR